MRLDSLETTCVSSIDAAAVVVVVAVVVDIGVVAVVHVGVVAPMPAYSPRRFTFTPPARPPFAFLTLRFRRRGQ